MIQRKLIVYKKNALWGVCIDTKDSQYGMYFKFDTSVFKWKPLRKATDEEFAIAQAIYDADPLDWDNEEDTKGVLRKSDTVMQAIEEASLHLKFKSFLRILKKMSEDKDLNAHRETLKQVIAELEKQNV